MTWFETLTGFKEADYETTRSLLRVEGSMLISKVNGRRMHIGELTTPSLAQLREQARQLAPSDSPLRLSTQIGDVREMHRRPEFRGALFQVASQFNLVEMVGPSVTPEDGVSGYAHDPAQGLRCPQVS